MAKQHTLAGVHVNRHFAGLAVFTALLLPAFYHVMIFIKTTYMTIPILYM